MAEDFSDFSDIDLATNPDPRCPVILILDASSSMAQSFEGESDTPLNALNAGLDVLISELRKDPLARRRVELSVVSFGTDVTPATKFATIDNATIPTLVPSGITSMGQAIEVALDAVEARKREYKAAGVEFYRPWGLLVTDGAPTDSIENAAKRIKEAEAAKKIAFFPVGVEGADFETLSQLSTREPLKLKGIDFSSLFVWLSASQSAVSASQPGDAVQLPSPSGWAEI